MNEDIFHYYYLLDGHKEVLIFAGIHVLTDTATGVTRDARLLSTWFLLTLHSGLLLLIQIGIWIAVKTMEKLVTGLCYLKGED